MIHGLHDDPKLRQRQMEFLIARLAFQNHILTQAIGALYTFEPPKTEEERANAMLTLQTSLQQADDPMRVQAFSADHEFDLLPTSMR